MFDPITMALCECECAGKPEGDNAGGGLPVVELETVATAEGAMLSFDDIAKLEAVGYALPCVVKCVVAELETDAPLCVIAQGVSDIGNTGTYTAGGYADFGDSGKYGVIIMSAPVGFVIQSIITGE